MTAITLIELARKLDGLLAADVDPETPVLFAPEISMQDTLPVEAAELVEGAVELS